jgi:hypothetical protein
MESNSNGDPDKVLNLVGVLRFIARRMQEDGRS